MRGQRSFKILVVLALVSGCSPDDSDGVAVMPEPPTAERERPAETRDAPGPSQSVINVVRQGQADLNGIRESPPPSAAAQVDLQSSRAPPSEVAPQVPMRLIFECADGVAFAVRMGSRGLVLYPPGYPPNGSITLRQVPSDSGMRYQAGDIDFRSEGDLATLQMGRERYSDCVANPAAAVWRDPLTLNSEQF